MLAAIEVRNLTKTYKTRGAEPVHAVRGIDLHVEEGEILEGFRPRSSGEVRVLGEDPATAPLSWRENVGVVLQESEADKDLTARESLQLYSSYYADPRPVEETLELVGLREHGDQRAKRLSGGQKRRLDLAVALIGDPKLIFLDEPTTGFDPSARREAWGMVENLRSVGATVLLTTHYMDEAESLSDRIVVISNGLIAAEGTAADLAEKVELLTVVSWDPAEVPMDAVPEKFAAATTAANGMLSVETGDVAPLVHALTGHAVSNGSTFDSLSVQRPNLEDTFLRLTDTAETTETTDEASS